MNGRYPLRPSEKVLYGLLILICSYMLGHILWATVQHYA